MASNQKGGIGSLGSLISAMTSKDAQDGSITMIPSVTNSESVEPQPASEPIPENNPIKKTRQKKTGSKTVLSKRGLHLSDNTIMRLTLLALERKTSLSQIADQILQSNLPDYVITKNKAG